MTVPAKPVVLVPACNRLLGEHPYLVVGRKYVEAVRLAGCQPLVVPGAEAGDLDALLDLADGVLLTGSPSNVHPRHFEEDVRDPSLPLDPLRDEWTLPLVPRIIARGVPLFAICRGAQETNVALGGTLHQAVHEVEGLADHREDSDTEIEAQYAPVHDINVLPDGVLQPVLGAVTIRVNSLHGQGINRLADGLRVEALAPDGLIEAFSVVRPGANAFSLGVQWHPEWRAAENPVSMHLLAAFGHACRAFRNLHRGFSPRPG